jgi:hypothetical protein
VAVEENIFVDVWPSPVEGAKGFACGVDMLYPAPPGDWPGGSGPPVIQYCYISYRRTYACVCVIVISNENKNVQKFSM